MNLLNILSFTLLFVPTVAELYADRNGDLNKTADTIFRFSLMIGFASGAHVISGVNWLAAFNLSLAIFFLCFDYLINIILYKNGVINYANWFSYTGKSGVVDNLSFWKTLNPYVKLLIRVTYFLIAIILYFRI